MKYSVKNYILEWLKLKRLSFQNSLEKHFFSYIPQCFSHALMMKTQLKHGKQ